jgi:hypothetical protein
MGRSMSLQKNRHRGRHRVNLLKSELQLFNDAVAN